MPRNLLVCVLVISLITPHHFTEDVSDNGAKKDETSDNGAKKDETSDNGAKKDEHPCENAACPENMICLNAHVDGIVEANCIDIAKGTGPSEVEIDGKVYMVKHSCPDIQKIQGKNELGGGNPRDCGPDPNRESCGTAKNCPKTNMACCSDACGYHCRSVTLVKKSIESLEEKSEEKSEEVEEKP